MTLVPLQSAPRRTRSAKRLHFAALGLLVALTGCQSIQSTVSNTGQIRFLHASADAPGLDIYQNTGALAYNLGFGTITSYVPLAPGSYNFAADSEGSRRTVAFARQTVMAGKQYTAIVGNDADNLQETIYLDQSTPAPAGQTALRILDQATRPGGVDIYLVAAGGKLTASSPFATNLAFGANSGYLNTAAGTYAIVVVPAGTVPAATTLSLISGTQTTYSAGAVRTVVLMDASSMTTSAMQAVIASDYDSPGAS